MAPIKMAPAPPIEANNAALDFVFPGGVVA